MKGLNYILLMVIILLTISCTEKVTYDENKFDQNNINPKISPQDSIFYNAQEVTITTGVEDATIHYTIDGKDPTNSSSVYLKPIIVSTPLTLKARAYKKGWYDSEIVQAEYSFQAATPTFNPPEGKYEVDQEVSISCASDSSMIRYTTDGTEPDTNSTPYTSPINITKKTTLKAKAFRPGWADSEIEIAEYSFQVITPTFNLPEGTYKIAQEVSISCATDGSIIRYTTDGADPDTNSTLYTNPIKIARSTTLKAKAFRPGWSNSSISNAEYAIVLINMVRVPAGDFIMGGTEGFGDNDELPAHSVTMSSFYIGSNLVTQFEYQEVMGLNPANNYGVGDNYPIYSVNWYSAIKFCNMLSMREELTPVYSINGSTDPANWGEVPTRNNSTWNAVVCNWDDNGYRLPTEAEWEYAAREGNNNSDSLYSGSNDIGEVAWYSVNNSPYGSKQVGSKSPNALGIYDMSGNVNEWCWDWYGSYSDSPSSDPEGPMRGSKRVMRGGYWDSNANSCRVACRNSHYPSNANYSVGFRVCRKKE